MKKLVIGFLAAVSSFTASAQWQISEVLAKDKSVAGYIYHTSATGTRIGPKTEKMTTSLRIVCSTKSNAPPILVLYWQGMVGEGNEYPTVVVDGKVFRPQQEVWIHEGPIFYRSIFSDDQLFKAIQKSNKIEFTWTDSGSKYITGFETNNIVSDLGNFLAVCKV